MKCRSPHSEVVNTRSTRGGSQIWRRRRCAQCGKVTTTYERQDLSFILVRSGTTETPYGRSFLFASLLKVIPDSSLDVIDVDNLVDTIEHKIVTRGQDTIDVSIIRQLVLETLKPTDINVFMNYLVRHSEFRNKTDVKSAIKHY